MSQSETESDSGSGSDSGSDCEHALNTYALRMGSGNSDFSEFWSTALQCDIKNVDSSNEI